MKKCIGIKKFSFISLLIFGVSVLYAQIDAKILSPIPGNWSNYQSLIINVPAGCNVYYSCSGSDPRYSGFAYDKPVLLENEGEILLRVVTIDSFSNVSEQQIKFFVNRVPVDQNFYSQSSLFPYIPLDNEKGISIPSSMKYIIGDGVEPFLEGQLITLTYENALERYVPLVISDFGNLYRVMLQIKKDENSLKNNQVSVNASTIPVSIICKNWQEFVFSAEEGVLYSLDGQAFLDGTQTLVIDRTKAHVLSWMYNIPIDEKQKKNIDNNTFIIPAKPEILGSYKDELISSNQVVLQLSDFRYKMKRIDDSDENPFCTSFSVDTVFGDYLNETISFEVYLDDILQGNIEANVRIDKRPPLLPKYISSSETFYSREPVDLSIESDETIYYQVIGPISFDLGFDSLEFSQNDDIIKDIDKSKFKVFDSKRFTLKEDRESAVRYIVVSYAKDKANNSSGYSIYSCVIDKYNYYINADLPPSDVKKDGSPARPYTTFEDVVYIFNNQNFTRLYVTGKFENVPSFIINCDCEIVGNDTTRLVFDPDSKLVVENVDFSVKNCVFEQNNKIEKISDQASMFQKSLFELSDAKLNLTNCEIISILGVTGSVIKADNSVVAIDNCRLTTQTEEYASVVSANKSSISCVDSSITAISSTTVGFSLTDCNLFLSNNDISVHAHLGRIGELSLTKYNITRNKLEFSKNVDSPFWFDFNCTKLAYENNQIMELQEK